MKGTFYTDAIVSFFQDMRTLMPSSPHLRLGTRGSALALTQAAIVKQALLACYPQLQIDIIPIQTTGDMLANQNLADIGGKGLFITEIEDQLLSKQIDLAVHSLKDMPAHLPDALTIVSILPREDARDVLLSIGAQTIADLPRGSVLGTSSPRRAAQILHIRPDLIIEPFRGNVPTRITKFQSQQNVTSTVLAMAGLNRLGRYDPHCMHPIAQDIMLPAVAQGAIGIEVRKDHALACELIAPLNHAASSVCVHAERLFLGHFETASCRTPIAAHAFYTGQDTLRFTGLIASPDGRAVYKKTIDGSASDLADIAVDTAKELHIQAGASFFG